VYVYLDPFLFDDRIWLISKALCIATVAILIRSIFRVIELWDGFNSGVAQNEALLMLFEGPFIIFACFALTICHPGVVFKDLWHEANWSLRRRDQGKVRFIELEEQGLASSRSLK
jgi:hypothetical protein